MGLAVPDRRVEPVPRGGGVDKIEALRLCLPGFERGNLDLDGEASEVAASVRGKMLSHLDADDRESTLHQRPGRLSGRTADLQKTASRLQLAQLDKVVEQLRRIRGPRRLVEVGGTVKRATQPIKRLVHLLHRPKELRRVTRHTPPGERPLHISANRARPLNFLPLWRSLSPYCRSEGGFPSCGQVRCGRKATPAPRQHVRRGET